MTKSEAVETEKLKQTVWQFMGFYIANKYFNDSQTFLEAIIPSHSTNVNKFSRHSSFDETFIGTELRLMRLKFHPF